MRYMDTLFYKKNMDMSPHNQSFKVLAVKGVAAISFQNVLLQGIWFFTSIVLLNAISVTEFSILKIVFATIAVPSALFIAGLDPIILADMGVERERGNMGVVKSLFRAYIIFELVAACCIWIGFVFFLSLFKQYFEYSSVGTLVSQSGSLHNTYQYLFAASFTIFSKPLQNIYIQFFSLYFQFTRVTYVKLFDELVTLGATVYFVFFLHQGIYAAILIQIVSPFVALALTTPAVIALYKKQLHEVKSESADFFARIKAHGKWSIGSAYVMKVTDALHLYFIDQFIGRPAVAIFSLADALWGHLISLFPIKSILDTVVPQRSLDETVARNNLIRGIKYSFLGFMILGSGAAIGGYPFLYMFFPKYIQSFPVFLGLLLLIPRIAFSSALAPLLRAYKYQFVGFTAACISLFFTTVFAYILYPVFGMKGVVCEVVLTSSVYVYINYVLFIKKYPAFRIQCREIFSWDAYDSELIGIAIKGFWIGLNKIRRKNV